MTPLSSSGRDQQAQAWSEDVQEKRENLEEDFFLLEDDGQELPSSPLPSWRTSIRSAAAQVSSAARTLGTASVGAFTNLSQIANTAIALTSSLPLTDQQKQDPRLVRLANPGKQLSDAEVNAFIRAITKGTSIHLIVEHYSPINLNKLDGLKRSLGNDLRERLTIRHCPIIMPVVFENRLGGRHVTMVIIKDSVIAFYDSQGKSARDHKLHEGGSMYDLLEHLNQGLFASQYSIRENLSRVQTNVNDCGVLISRYAYHKIFENEDMNTFNETPVSAKDLKGFRQYMISTIS